MSAPSRRSTSCSAASPIRRAAILFYSTDYDELIGCCDRVLVLYDGAIKRELVGAEITEQRADRQRAEHRRRRGRQDGEGERMSEWRYWFAGQQRHAAGASASSS